MYVLGIKKQINVRTIANLPIICCTDPVMALAAGTIELLRLCGLTDADAAVTFAPTTARLAIRCPAAAQGRLCGQLAHTTHLAEKIIKGQLFCCFGISRVQRLSALPPT